MRSCGRRDAATFPKKLSFYSAPPCPAEYCARGSVYDVLKQGTHSPAAAAELTWQRRLDIAVGAARGLLYLHLSSEPIVHGDVRRGGVGGFLARLWAKLQQADRRTRMRSGAAKTTACG